MRLVPVTGSLLGGVWSVVLNSPSHVVLQPDGAGQLGVTVDGNAQAELSVPASSVQQIQITGSSGADTISLAALTRSLFSTTPVLSINSGVGNDSVIGGNGLATFIDGGDGDDTLRGFYGDDTFAGGNGNDLLDGASGRDVLRGLAGNDTLFGQAGDDLLVGGAGRDSLLGGAGNDLVQGQGGSGDVVDGGSGNDSLAGGEGHDILRGGAGDDLLDGQSGNDSISGDTGQDLLFGSEGDDSLQGLSGRDVLIGGVGADVLAGGDGEDILMGAATTLNAAQLDAIRTRWIATDPYRLRVAALTNATSSLVLLPGNTLVEDNVLDTLSGGPDRDWFTRPLDADSVLDVFSDRTRDEALNASIPIARAEVRPSGHGSAALDELVPEDAATHIAIANGAWSDPAIWSAGSVPSAAAVVLIEAGISVTVDGVFTDRVAGLAVHGGLLFATDRNTQLTVDTLIVHQGGRFEMGSAAAPIQAHVTATIEIADRGPIDRALDVFALGRGFLAESTVEIHGAAKTGFRTLQTGVGIGQTRLRLVDGVPTDWRVGDQLVLAGTSVAGDEDEQLVLLGIEGDAVLVQPLAYSHLFPVTTAPLNHVLHIHLANLTRNAVIRSESTALDRRGHVMFMHMDDVEIEYAAFNDLGRTDKKVAINDVLFDGNDQVIAGTGTNPRGRYALHFHRAGVVNDGHAALVRGSVVARSPGWGFSNHSSFVNFEGNVSYDVDGAGFATEAGDEIGSFVGNLAIRGHGSGMEHNARFDIQDFGHQGDGFWIQGGGVRVENNAASGMQGNGLIIYTRALVEWDRQDDSSRFDQGTLFLASNLEFSEVAKDSLTAEVYDVPVRHFRGNEAYASEIGINLDYFNYRPDTDFDRPRHLIRSIVENLTSWNSRQGVVVAYVTQTDLRDIAVIGRVSRPTSYGIKAHLKSSDVTFEKLHVEGYAYGLTMPRRGTNLVDGGYFNNIDNITNLSIQQVLAAGTPVGSFGLENTIRNVTFGTLTSAALRGTVQRNVILTSWNLPNLGSFANVFEPMSVVLDFGTFDNQRAYFALQSPDAIVFPVLVPELNPDWLFRTNQELNDLFNLRFGDTIAPNNFVTSDQVFADIGPLTDRLGRLATSQAARIAP